MSAAKTTGAKRFNELKIGEEFWDPASIRKTSQVKISHTTYRSVHGGPVKTCKNVYSMMVSTGHVKTPGGALVVVEILGERKPDGIRRAEAFAKNGVFVAAAEAPTRADANIALRNELRRRDIPLSPAAKKKLDARCALAN
jgi:hypothetical protein